MYVDAKDRGIFPHLLKKGVYEKHQTELFKKLIKRGMVVVDIGANIGYHTLIASKLVGETGKVYAFEPELNNYTLLLNNIKINGCNNITPIQKAISNKKGKIKLFIENVNLGGHSFSESNILYTEKPGFKEVETITLDDFFENLMRYDKIDIIKMDVQGAEGLIIEGARKILSIKMLKIIMEFWPYGLESVGTDPSKLLSTLQNYGFKMKVINGINQYIPPIKIIKICKKYDSNCHIDLLLEK